MTNHGDDCFFFYYSTCSKGDDCPFRHCEAAMGNETVCRLWEEGRCFRPVCKFRHMEITKNRKEIACYWENQPSGCQKPHCAFFHEKPRHNKAIFVPPNKSLNKNEEQQPEEPAPQPPAPLPTTANPQLRGVIKTDTQELVPSPTHPPVVINPADDDEDEDDQFSEEGEDGKVGPSLRKLHKSDDSLNFGVSTLEEIRLRRALKASMKRAGYPLQSAQNPVNGEKENIQSLFRPAVFQSGDVPTLLFQEAGRPRGSVVERLGRKMPNTDMNSGDGPPLKRSLAERLGRVMDMEDQSTTPQKPFKPVKERLGLVSLPDAPTQSADTSEESINLPKQIHIKTLEEIRQEKATKTQPESQKDAPETTKSSCGRVSKAPKRAISVKHSSIGHVKTFSEILRAKKIRQEEEEEQSLSPKKAKHVVEKAAGKNPESSDSAGLTQEVTKGGEVRVKTLEEIRREKAARGQSQQNMETENKKSFNPEEDASKRPWLLRVNKLTPHSNETTEMSPEESSQPAKPAAAVTRASNNVKVKTFEEIMQEKRLRKQEREDQARSSAEVEPPFNQTPPTSLKRKLLTPPRSTSPSSLAPLAPDSTQKVPIHKMIPLRSVKSPTAPDTQLAASVPIEKRSTAPEARSRNTRNVSTVVPTPDPTQKKSPQHTVDTKVRPKLNVRPSVVKVQLKPGQKRKAAEKSAVAAVKPLNSTSTGQEETQQDTVCRDTQVVPSLNAETQLSSAVPQSPGSLLDATCSPVREELQTIPIFMQSPHQDPKPAAREACAVPQSSILKTSAQAKLRRPSVAASRSSSGHANTAATSSSAVDDFDMLINEFTDDHLEDEVDPGIGEDDLLQELSEMIDS